MANDNLYLVILVGIVALVGLVLAMSGNGINAGYESQTLTGASNQYPWATYAVPDPYTNSGGGGFQTVWICEWIGSNYRCHMQGIPR